MSDHVRHYKGKTCTVTIKNVPVHLRKLFQDLAELTNTNSDSSPWISKEFQKEEETQSFCAFAIHAYAKRLGTESLKEYGVIVHDPDDPMRTFELVEPI